MQELSDPYHQMVAASLGKKNALFYPSDNSVFFQNEEIISLNNQMAENNTKAPTQKSGERLSDNSKTEDVRMSNITAAKGKHAFEFQLIYSCC